MALGGGGSGGGPISSTNPAGTGSSLNYIGNHAYAYSGAHSATAGGPTTMLEFTTGNEYIIGEFTFGNTSASTDHVEFEISVNNQIVMAAIGDAIGESFPLNSFQLVIPSYSTIKVTAINASGGADRTVFAAISGRIYA